MKKFAIITSAVLIMFSAAVNAQTDTVPKAPTEQQVPVETTEPVPAQPATTEKPVNNDKYNNWSADTYKMQPMPEALTTEKIFPVVGAYQLTNSEGASATVNVMLDPSNKGIIWIEGLPQGKIKATLRKSPATYKIPAQKLGEDEVSSDMDSKDSKTAKNAKASKELPEGVLIYDKDANVLNVCIGCKFNNEDPAIAFLSSDDATAKEDMEKTQKKEVAKSKSKSAKTSKIKPVHYTGTKVIETTASTATQLQ